MTEKPEGNSHGPQQLAAILGVLFVAAWAAFGFADALLCLIGAVVLYLATAIYRDELDLAELRQRSQPRASRASRSANESVARLSEGQHPPGDGSEAQLAPVFLTPPLSSATHALESNDVPGGEALGHMRLIYRNTEPRDGRRRRRTRQRDRHVQHSFR